MSFDKQLYMCWYNARLRCYNKDIPKYKSYGERGITMCDEWKNDFKEFEKWAIKHGYIKGLSLERIDVNGNYEPSNCKWITNEEQVYNKQNTRKITFKTNTYPVCTWEKILKLGKNTCDVRYKLGWNVEKLLTKRGDNKYLYPHQVDILGRLYPYNKCALFLDMGL